MESNASRQVKYLDKRMQIDNEKEITFFSVLNSPFHQCANFEKKTEISTRKALVVLNTFFFFFWKRWIN